jgi:hypothetical protein
MIVVIHPWMNTIMRVEHKLLVLSVTLAGAIAGAMSVQVGGFGDSPAQTGQATAIAHTVADVTSAGNAVNVK